MFSRTVRLEDIYNYVEGEVPGYKGTLTLSTRLGEDLRIIGDDASEFLERFSEQFNVDLSGFIFSDYFPAEGSSDMRLYTSHIAGKNRNDLLRFLGKLDGFIWGAFSEKRFFKSITLENLYQAAKSGTWE